VTIEGTPSDERLEGTDGRDVIHSLAGDDEIRGVGKRDVVCAGGGADVVTGVRARGFDAPLIDLGSGDDQMRGWSRNVRAGAGDDTLILSAGGAGGVVHPGLGDDAVRVQNPQPQAFFNTCVVYRRAVRPVIVNLRKRTGHGQGQDRLHGVRCIEGSRFADVLVGSGGNEWLQAGGGDDRMYAGAGHDLVDDYGGGDGLMALGAGRDQANGYGGADTVYGGPGEDMIVGAGGADRLFGGRGDDRVYGTYYCDLGSSAGTGMGDRSANRVYGGPGKDEVTGDRGDDVIHGGDGVDRGYPGPSRSPGADVFLSVEDPTTCV
jgi:Ca2+-binding RTX toxin-like protein